MKKVFVIVFSILLGVSSCVTDQLEYAIYQQLKLFDAIVAYKFSQNEVAKLIEGGIEAARTNLSNQKNKVISYQPIAFEWKARLKKIDYELETLTQKLKKIDEMANQYFEKLDTVTNSIKEKALREAEHNLNQKLKQEWDSIYQIGVQSLANIKKINLRGQDVRKVIINDGLRQENKSSLQALQNIQQEYRAELAAMSDFACKAAKKISLKNADLKSVCKK